MLAKELAIPILAIAQLSRESERRPDKRPQLSDLRDSGALEQDANTVILLHRPDRYDESAQPGLTEVIVPEVTDYEWTRNGTWIAYAVSSTDTAKDGAFARRAFCVYVMGSISAQGPPR